MLVMFFWIYFWVLLLDVMDKWVFGVLIIWRKFSMWFLLIFWRILFVLGLVLLGFYVIVVVFSGFIFEMLVVMVLFVMMMVIVMIFMVFVMVVLFVIFFGVCEFKIINYIIYIFL